MYKIILFIAIAFFLSSCKKKVVEIVPTLTIIDDLSINGANDIRYISYISRDICFAATDSCIYKTINGGGTWVSIDVEGNFLCRGIAFFDELNGMCLMDIKLYTTHDGGETWNFKGYGDFVFVNEDGIGFVGDCSSTYCDLQKTYNKGETFSNLIQFPLDASLRGFRFMENKILIINDDAQIEGYNLSMMNKFDLDINANYDEFPRGIYMTNNDTVVVGLNGLIMDPDLYLDVMKRSNYSNNYDYYDIDGNDDYQICVGENIISTNLDIASENEWNPVFDINGNGFDKLFRVIRFIEKDKFLLGGSNGYLIIGTIL
ncbi:MAG: hypothetical protein JXR58_08605 [Bacteroidales bacterium]|nr:hypothetical protein [Bacteroidales bacterium]